MVAADVSGALGSQATTFNLGSALQIFLIQEHFSYRNET